MVKKVLDILFMKKYLLFFAAAIVFNSCDVRRSDKIMDDTVVREEKEKKEIKASVDAALRDSTTVQLIDSVYDFGTIKQGELVQHSFSFKNTGTKPLVVQDAHASCGCTVPEKPEKPIKPGEIGVIKVVFDSKGKSDHQEKDITVTSNAHPEFGKLKLTGTVTKPE
jgi:hypothetical protein